MNMDIIPIVPCIMNNFLVIVCFLPLLLHHANSEYDISHSKPAIQSYTFQNNTDSAASKAVDGYVSTCSFTAMENEPRNLIGWWQVDLGDVYSVTNVTITNTDHTSYFRAYQYLAAFVIFVGTTNNTNNPSDLGSICYAANALTGSSGQPVSFNCQNQPLRGRYLTVRKHYSDADTRQDALTLCEVVVYGFLGDSSSTTTTTTMSTTSSTTTTTTTTKTMTPSSSTTTTSLSGTLSTISTLSTSNNSPTTSSNTSSPPGATGAGSSLTSTNPSESTRNSIIIGVVVGLFCLIVVILVVFFLVRRFSNTSASPNHPKRLIEVDLPKYVRKETVKGFTAVQKNIKVSELDAYIQNRKNGGFSSEFKDLPEEDLENAIVSKSPENSKKNRFLNVLPYDDYVVPLLVDEDDDPTDNYINASFIVGYKDMEKCYIATQGPKAITVKDIWRMIWQQNVNCIVMVTPLIENNKRRCEQYWPENLQETKVYHKISVTLAVEEVYADYVYRQLVVNDTRQKDKPSRIVRHMHFVSWADKNRPEHCFPLLAFRHRVKNLQDASTGPLLVHCSAGIGRTGTYIALDYLLNQAEQEHEISVFKCVKELRFQRMNMVQTADQYEFVYEAVLEGVTDGNTGIPCLAFDARYEELKKTSGLEEQFKLLNERRKTKPGRQSLGTKDKNIARNRNKSIVAFDDCRPYLQTTTATTKSDYINAVFVDGYRSKDAYILTQVPLPGTIIDFWGLVWDHCLETIVLLEELDGEDESSPIYWPEGSASETYGQFDVELISVNKESSTVWWRQFSLTNSKDRSSEPMNVLQYQFAPGIWLNKFSIPSKTSSILQLTKLLTNNTGKIILQCSDGASRSGLVAAAMHMIDMMKVEQIVDVFLVCRYIIVNRPQAIDDLNQYKFLHDLALECIKEHDEYDNLQTATIYVNLPSP